MTQLCICQICNCGRHHCPHKPRGTIPTGTKACTLSEYTNRYIKHPMERTQDCKPRAEAFKSSDPLDDKTTHRVDFVKYPTEKPYVHMPEEYRPKSGSMDMMTSYAKEYTKKPVNLTKSSKKEYTRKLTGKFEGTPTYKADYRKWQIPERMRYGEDNGWRPPSAQFEGKSTFTHDYIKYNEPVRQSLKPTETAMKSKDPFDDATGYRIDYIQHPMPDRYVRDKPAWAPNKQPLDGLSNYMKDYIEKKGAKQESCKPNAKPYDSGAPFKGETTQRNDYKKWDAERPWVRDAEQYIKPEGDMDMNTTTHLDFQPHKLDKPKLAQPPTGRKVPGKFEGTTNYRTDFRAWEANGRMRPIVRTDYNPPTAPFEGMSTFTAHYIPHRVEPTISCKPEVGALSTNAPFEDGTMYRIEYTQKKVAPCPAAVLDTTQSQFIYREQDDTGHKFYAPVYESVSVLPGQRATPSNQLATLTLA